MGTRIHTYGRELSRRSFLTRALGLIALGGAVLGGVHAIRPQEPPSLRTVRRYSYETDTWTQVRMYELRKGDVFELEEVGIFEAYADPEKQPDGVWAIQTITRIDPATNQWVPDSA